MSELKFSGPARCFDSEEECFEAVTQPQLQGRRGSRHPLRGAEGRPRHARDAVDDGGALRPGHGRQGGPHHRRAFLGRDARFLHRPCRAGGGGRRPDRAAAGRRHHHDRCRRRARSTSSCPTTELAARAKSWKPRTTDYQSGAIWKYAQTVGPARDGAVTHPGGARETHCYADI